MKLKLDKVQQQIVDCNDPRICVIAGAGSGKTCVLTQHIRRLLSEGADPSKMIAITFTKMAASEMKQRLSDIPAARKMFVGTIHSLAYRTVCKSGSFPDLLTPEKESEIVKMLISKYAKYLTADDFDVWCEKRRLRELGYIKKAEAKACLSTEACLELTRLLDIKDLSGMFEFGDAEERKVLASRILAAEKDAVTSELYPETVTSYANSHGLVTFNGLLEGCHNSFDKAGIEYVFVDEFQDVGLFEYRFLEALKPKNLFIVGDDFQSIYGFKGADFEYFKSIVSGGEFTVFKMVNNYRCCKKVVNFGNKVISQIDDVIPKKCVSMANNDLGSSLIHVEGGIHKVSGYLSNIDPQDYGKWFFLARSNDAAVDLSRLCYRMNIPACTFKKGGLSSEQLADKLSENSVKILTIHAAKGLESENVLIYGKYPKDTDSEYWEEQGTEECRIFYVGATRAKRNLVIVDTSNCEGGKSE